LKIVESKQFKEELKAIAFYIRKDKPSASVSFVKLLKAKVNLLRDFPYQYKPSIYFENEKIRDMGYRGYTIVYEIDKPNNRLILNKYFQSEST